MSTGFLVTNLTGKLKLINDVVNQHVLKKLYIYISVNRSQTNLHNKEWVSKRITDMYSSSFSLFPDLDVRIILNEIKIQECKLAKINDYNVDVVLLPKNYDEEKFSFFKSLEEKLMIIYTDEMEDDDEQKSATQFNIYNNVVLGGTFDRLHTGHKILLSEALLRCSKKLTVGVTDKNMIKGKKLWELIEPCTKRIQEVETFIKETDASVEYEVVPITDMYGPTKSDPDLNMIVVSEETQKGGLKVNELRKEKGLNELDIHVVCLAEDTLSCLEEEKKISSSNVRMRLLGTYLKLPEDKPELPSLPHLIGFTGGIASGKSSICEYIQELGAGVVNCDKIAHNLYEPGLQIYFKLINLFGEQILTENKEINRRVLGGIVFNNPEKLEILNNLMWPAILEASIEECNRLYVEEKKEIIVLEAAVLLKAGWQKNVHEVWATIIPEAEAIKRIMDRNKVTEDEARSRIEAQMSNIEVVENSNVIFCSLWSYELTRKQVDRAWESVQVFLKK